MAKNICTVEDCGKPVHGRGLCAMHYARFMKHGTTDLRLPPYKPLIDRVMSRVVMTPGPLSSDCWICMLTSSRDGYARVNIDARTPVLAHRFTYEHFIGPIPTGLHLDHLCRVRRCVNPDHLEAVTQQENNRRSMSPSAITWRTGVCARGHSMDDAFVGSNGHRRCRACIHLTRNLWAAKRRAARSMGV